MSAVIQEALKCNQGAFESKNGGAEVERVRERSYTLGSTKSEFSEESLDSDFGDEPDYVTTLLNVPQGTDLSKYFRDMGLDVGRDPKKPGP